jgi:hypothetical protein
MTVTPRFYWNGQVGPEDDFGAKIHTVFYDAPISGSGQWAIMTHRSWVKRGMYLKLGPGFGQRYEKQSNGRWLKTGG